ncbi:hypothetical protein BDP27DRAFT_1386526 [Rhodocollybia butyracea]|uniref:Uncharacterized protein n=1 Tax=Rhodocollybia butyracea TaxID=206335 RepID=A0A9P5P5V2_9AGAR|nr:hypothetical protein BDP27DRAFT_1386526 [Rhodocollybia butyracea]
MYPSYRSSHCEQVVKTTSPKKRSIRSLLHPSPLRKNTIGFYDPVVQDQPQPMPGVMPNIVSLPYATSWRHLLKLMARLSGTRLEPTPQATQRGVDLHLRTVIQFVRTVLWFTIDQDAERPILRRSSTSNVEGLPFSYSQMKLPALLRDGSDSPISKTYNILPLHPSSGMRKFAKMLEICYPDEFDGGTAPAERSYWEGYKSSKKGRGGNEETYDLVTPFVPDEWG